LSKLAFLFGSDSSAPLLKSSCSSSSVVFLIRSSLSGFKSSFFSFPLERPLAVTLRFDFCVVLLVSFLVGSGCFAVF